MLHIASLADETIERKESRLILFKKVPLKHVIVLYLPESIESEQLTLFVSFLKTESDGLASTENNCVASASVTRVMPSIKSYELSTTNACIKCKHV